MMQFLMNTAIRFKKDEKGIALTEYLILLGLLTGAVITAVLLFGTELGIAWGSWADWIDDAKLGYGTDY